MKRLVAALALATLVAAPAIAKTAHQNDYRQRDQRAAQAASQPAYTGATHDFQSEWDNGY